MKKRGNPFGPLCCEVCRERETQYRCDAPGCGKAVCRFCAISRGGVDACRPTHLPKARAERRAP